jgi:hypothetical protein
VEWEDRLARLLVDSELRTTMGQRGREIAETEYALDRSSRRLLEVMEQLVREIP